jgi:hypothetical protein
MAGAAKERLKSPYEVTLGYIRSVAANRSIFMPFCAPGVALYDALWTRRKSSQLPWTGVS